MASYICAACGHVYHDSEEEVPFDQLPDDWRCPICGSTKDKYYKVEE